MSYSPITSIVLIVVSRFLNSDKTDQAAVLEEISVGDKNPKSKAKDEKRKVDNKQSAAKQAQAAKDAKSANNSGKPKK